MNPESNCFYCGKSTDEKKDYYVHTFYQVISVKGFPIGYKYKSREIYIPRCKSCKHKHDKFLLYVGLPIFIIITTLLFLWFYFRAEGWKWWSAFLISGFLSIFISGVIEQILDALFFSRIFNIPKEDSIENYPSVKTLLDLGWKFSKPDPASVSEDDIAKDSPYYRSSK